MERAIDALISFVSDRWQEKYWSDFYMVSIFDEYQSAGFAAQVEIFAMIREFINTGKRLDADKFWLDRENRSKEVRKKENKYKILSAVVLILYSILITAELMGECHPRNLLIHSMATHIHDILI